MKKLFIALLFISFKANSQYYLSVMPGFYTSSGNSAERTTFDMEIGKQWNEFSMGIDIGKTNVGKVEGKDTTTYFEWRPNLNVFQQGRFTNTLTIGLGYIPGASQNMLTECSTGIEYTINKYYHYNLYFGTYYFSGNISSSNQNFIGMSIIYFFK